VWHCFTFDQSANTSDVSIISMSSRPETLRGSVVTVTLPGCTSPEKAETVEVVLHCRPPSKERSRGEEFFTFYYFLLFIFIWWGGGGTSVAHSANNAQGVKNFLLLIVLLYFLFFIFISYFYFFLFLLENQFALLQYCSSTLYMCVSASSQETSVSTLRAIAVF
jgi:hypothetical protein